MTPGHREEQLIRQYLLNGLAPDEREAVTRRLMEDADFFDRVLEAEDDLIDAAARGELDASQAASLSGMLRASSQEHRLDFAQALRRAAGQAQRPRKKPWRYAAAAGVLIACGLSWLAFDNYRLRTSLKTANPPALQQPAAAVYALFLAAGVTRGSGAVPGFQIPLGTAIVELQLEAAGAPPPPYSVELRTLAGRVLALQRVDHRVEQAGSGGPIRVPVSAFVLEPGNYEVEISAETGGSRRPVEFYYLRIE